MLSYNLHLRSHLMRLEEFLAAKVWAEGCWDANAAVGLLVCLHERQHDTGRGDGCVVERMWELHLALFVAIADIGAAGLPIVQVRARVRLTVSVFAREPAFKVIHAYFAIAHVAGADIDHTIGQF